jgi:hypothetical protein
MKGISQLLFQFRAGIFFYVFFSRKTFSELFTLSFVCYLPSFYSFSGSHLENELWKVIFHLFMFCWVIETNFQLCPILKGSKCSCYGILCFLSVNSLEKLSVCQTLFSFLYVCFHISVLVIITKLIKITSSLRFCAIPMSPKSLVQELFTRYYYNKPKSYRVFA